MLKNGLDLPTGSVQSADVCIVGTGQAGITLAYYLYKAGVKVLLLEGSRTASTFYQDNWPDKKYLYNGEVSGLLATNEPEFLIRPDYSTQNGPWERERTFGGTSTHWGGQCRPFDPIDFEEISENYPGWPITRQDLDPYYAEASNFCLLHGDYGNNGANFDAEYWAQILNDEVPKLDGFNAEMYQYIGQDYLNFATKPLENGKTISDLVDVIFNATLLDINQANGSVESLTIASMEGTPPGAPTYKGHSFTVKAQKYVLAMGAVANARQMLLTGINNDNIGRYFMCHPLVNNSPKPILVSDNYLSAAELGLMTGDNYQDDNGVSVQGRFIPNESLVKSLKIGRCWFWGTSGGQNFYFEQAANPNSRVTLSDTTDPVFGQYQAKVDWEFCDADENTYNQVTAQFIKAVKQLNPQVKVTCVSWDSIKSSVVINGHHLGTTRMSTDASTGVVNADLQSHDLENLYIAGSSVWASAAISNPTFTIIALSIRLAEHLAGQLKDAI